MSTTKEWPWHAKIQAERGRRGWTYAHVARRVKEESSLTRRWLRGETRPRGDVIPKFAKLMGWPIAYLMDENKPYPPEMDDDWREAVLDGLDEHRTRLMNAMADDQAVAYLVKALDQFEDLRESLGED